VWEKRAHGENKFIPATDEAKISTLYLLEPEKCVQCTE
jgi:hypothetical protein